jgi:chaperonin GroES
MNESGFIPTGDKVLVLVAKVENKTSGGIVLPDVAKDKEMMARRVGNLLAVAPDAEGAPELHGIELGDVVLFTRYSGDDFPVDGIVYRIMRVQDILGKVTKLPDYVLEGAKSSVEVFGQNTQLPKPQSLVAA